MSSEDAVRVTLKAGVGYDAPWITIGGATVEEVGKHLEEAVQHDLFQLTAVAAGRFATEAKILTPMVEGGLGAVPVAAPAQAAQVAPTPAPAPAAAPQGDATTTCVHGARIFRSGVGAKGPWSAWFCPTPKGTPDQCKPQWATN